MFPAMRRNKQQLPAEECAAIFRAAPCGILGTAGTDGYPYAVPVSFAYLPAAEETAETGGRIIFHCAADGRKLDALAANPHVSFTVVAQSEPVPEKLTDRFCSVIGFGTARRAEGAEKQEGLLALGAKYAPGLDAIVAEEIETTAHRTVVIVIDLEHVTGKEGLELTRERRNAAR